MRTNRRSEGFFVIIFLDVVEDDPSVGGGMHEISVAEVETNMREPFAMPGVRLEEDEVTHPEVRLLYFDAGLQLVWYNASYGYAEHFAQKLTGEGRTIDPGLTVSSETIFYPIPVINETQQLLIGELLDRQV